MYTLFIGKNRATLVDAAKHGSMKTTFKKSSKNTSGDKISAF